MKMYHGVKFDTAFLDYHCLDGFFKVPLTYENELVKIPSNLEESISEILRNMKSGEKPANSKSLKKFLDIVEAYENIF